MFYFFAFTVLFHLYLVIALEETNRIHHQKVRDGILQKYPKNIPPEKIVEVGVNFTTLYIRDLKVESQTFSLFGSWFFRWYDSLLTWNISDLRAPHALTFNSNEIWSPRIILSNNAQTTPLKPEDYIIIADGRGNVVMVFTKLLETQCHVDVSRYPFDVQICDVSLVPYFDFTYRKPKVGVLPRAESLGKSVEWRLLKTSVDLHDVPEAYVQNVVVFEFKLKREYLFYLMSVIAPVWLLSVMTSCVFLLPVESGEKISYLISILVSYSVFINYINEVMPKSGTPSRLGIYLVLVLCESCAAIIVTLGVLNYHYKPKEQGEKSVRKTDVKDTQENTDKTTGTVAVQTKRNEHSKERVYFFIFLIFALLSPSLFFI